MKETLSFEDWLDYVFDRPIATESGEEWYWQDDEAGQPLAWWRPEPTEIAEFLIRLFESPTLLLQRFTELQLCQGLWFIFGCGSAPNDGDDDWFSKSDFDFEPINYVLRALDSRVPNPVQVRLVRSILVLYRELFEPACSNWFGLSRDEPLPDDPELVNPLDDVCWMIWDSSELAQIVRSPRYSHLVDPAFDVLEQMLNLKSANCRAAALHGLGHLQETFPTRVGELVDVFLAKPENLHPNLIRYAADARSGELL